MLLNKVVVRRLSNAFVLKVVFRDCPMLLFESGFGNSPMFFIYKTKSFCFG